MVPGRKAPDISSKDREPENELGIPKVELSPKDEFAKWRKPVETPRSTLDPLEEVSRLEAKHQFWKRNNEAARMLVVEGLPTSLVSSDFLRLNAKDLASWRNLIKEGAYFPNLHHSLEANFEINSPAGARSVDARPHRHLPHLVRIELRRRALPGHARPSPPSRPDKATLHHRSLDQRDPARAAR